MNVQQLGAYRDRLSDLAARRYRDRSAKREEKLRAVEEKGVLAAADPSAVVGAPRGVPAASRSASRDGTR